MNTLREISYILDRYKVRHIEVLTNTPQHKESRYFEYYTGLREDRWKTEEEIARHFNFDPGSKAFARFKNEVKKRLLNSLLFIDTSLPDFNDYNRAFIVLMQEWAVAKTLHNRGARLAFLELAEQVLAMGKKFEFVDIVFEVLKLCKKVTVTYPQHQKEYFRYLEAYQFYKEAYWQELEAREAYEELVQPLVNKRGLKIEFAAKARQLLETLRPMAEKNEFTLFQYYYRTIDIYADSLTNNWKGALAKTQSAIHFFNSKPFNLQGDMLIFAQQEIGCLVMLGRFDEARDVFHTIIGSCTEGRSNWFKLHELATVNSFYAVNYAEASWETVKMVTRHPRFGDISTLDRESWSLYQGYLFFLARSGTFTLSPREKGDLEKFRLSSLLNNLPLFSLDKRGANIPVLIVQVLFLLLEDRLDEFDNRVEALRKYRQRNLDPNSEHFRTDCFIRLVELIPKNNYRVPAIQKEAESWLEKMASISIDLLDRSYELEVVPYERQWKWILSLLAHQQVEGE